MQYVDAEDPYLGSIHSCDYSEDLKGLRYLQFGLKSASRGITAQNAKEVPALYVARRLYEPSIAASKDRMVSSGRSSRGRVGLDRSGSAA